MASSELVHKFESCRMVIEVLLATTVIEEVEDTTAETVDMGVTMDMTVTVEGEEAMGNTSKS